MHLYNGIPTYDRLFLKLETFNDWVANKKLLKGMSEELFFSMDFLECRRELCRSALHRSGQSELMRRATRYYNTHDRTMSLLRHPLWCPPERTIFMQAIFGCHFLKPFNHKRKVKCRLCGAREATIKHLLLECTATTCSNIFPDTLNALKKSNISQAHELKAKLIHPGLTPNQQMHFYMGLIECSPSIYSYFMPSINIVTKTTAKKLLLLKAEWISAEPS